jgi:hypothetical protein
MDKYGIQLHEIQLVLNEINAKLDKQSHSDLLTRLENLEKSVKTQHLKLDALSSLDLPAVINAPTAPTTVRVATKEARAANVAPSTGNETPTNNASNTTVVKAAAGTKQFPSIVEFFKHMWVTDRPRLVEKSIINDELINKVKEEKKSELDKKSKNDVILQSTLARFIYRELSEDQKNILRSLQAEYKNDVNKSEAQEIVLEPDA